MLIFNKKLSVSPLTKHIPLDNVSKSINELRIIKNIKIIYNFYKKYFLKKPKFALLSLNPHNYYSSKNLKVAKKINKALKILKKNKINITGPIPSDSSFIVSEKYKFNVIIGMYHDQVLTPFKSIFHFDAINSAPIDHSSSEYVQARGATGNLISNTKSCPKSLVLL